MMRSVATVNVCSSTLSCCAVACSMAVRKDCGLNSPPSHVTTGMSSEDCNSDNKKQIHTERKTVHRDTNNDIKHDHAHLNPLRQLLPAVP